MKVAISQNRWVLAIKGFIAVAFGIVALLLPLETIITLTQVFGAFILLSGFFVIALLIRNRKKAVRYWHWFAIDAVFDIILGSLILSYPETTLLIFTFFIAMWFLFVGALQIIFSIGLYDSFRWWWLPLFNGMVTIILGLLIIFNPFEGVTAFTYLVSFAAIFYGLIHLITLSSIKRSPA